MKSLYSFSVAALIGSSLFFNVKNEQITPSLESTIVSEQSQCDADNNSFKDGEEITYKLYYNLNLIWLSAGEVTFKVQDMGDQYYLTAVGRTYSSYEWFFKVRDNYESFINKESLLPVKSVKKISEGSYRLYEKVSFDQNTRKANVLRGKSQEDATAQDFSLTSCKHDMLSVIYYVRNIDFDNLSVGNTVPISIFTDKKNHDLKVKFQGKQKNKHIRGLGNFNVIKCQPEMVVGEVFKDGDAMTIWASDDGNRIPLMIESPISVGSVKAVLKEYKGLRHTLSSKVK